MSPFDPSPRRPPEAAALNGRALVRVLGPTLAAALMLAAFGITFKDLMLEYGSITFLNSRYSSWLAFYGLFGGMAAVLLCWAISRLASYGRSVQGVAALRAYPDRRFLIFAALLALLSAALWRRFVFLEMPVTDDEGAYRFMAELLLSGRLYADSHPLKIFFDQSFFTNDGKYYTQYFLGWPALLAPFHAIGLIGWASACYHVLSVIGIFFLTRRQLGQLAQHEVSTGPPAEASSWAKVATLLTLFSPLLLFNAATPLSHSACFAALVWFAYFVVRTTEQEASAWCSAGASLCFSIAFFVRPQSAVPLGAALLAWWLMHIARRPAAERWRHLAAFAAPALPLAVAFLAVNQIQNGSPLLTAYTRTLQYAGENLYRFTHFLSPEENPGGRWGRSWLEMTSQLLNGVFRLNFAAFGWPTSFLFGALAVGVRAARPWFASLLVGGAFFFYMPDAGVDIIGPVHYTEFMLPLIMVSVFGLRQAASWLEGLAALRDEGDQRRLQLVATPTALMVALMLVSATVYWPMRARSQRLVSLNTRVPLSAPAEYGIDKAVIFVTSPFTRPCADLPLQGFVGWWPANHPDFENPIVYANHVSLEDNRRLQREYFPDRPGFLMALRSDCRPLLLPIESDLPAEADAMGLTGGLAAQPDAAEQGWLP